MSARGLRALIAGALLLFADAAAAACPSTTLLSIDEDWADRLASAAKTINAIVQDRALVLWVAKPDDSLDRGVPIVHALPGGANAVVAEVRAGCRAIVIDTVAFERAFANLAGGSDFIGDNINEMLFFVLLHELGHVKHGHYAAFLPPLDRPTDLNLDATLSKAEEEQADEFVANVLGGELLGFDSVPAEDFSASMAMSMTAIFLGKLSFHIAGRTITERPGARLLDDRSVFWDHGRSHPNFEFRVLRINHLMNPSETSQQLLDDFEAARTRAASPDHGVLYRAPRE